jgi:hypothetical protein
MISRKTFRVLNLVLNNEVMEMEIRKNFGKFWVTGLVFAIITGAIQNLTSQLTRRKSGLSSLGG